jgi:hypothetical protein
MTEPDIIREELVELSVIRAITTALPLFGYVLSGDGQNVLFREAFPTPTERAAELTMTTLAFGFNIDDGGEEAEMGTNLTKYVHTLVCWTFATSPTFGKRLAYTIKHIARMNLDSIALLDFNQQPDSPQIDTLTVRRVQSRHEVNNSARPWDKYVWTTSIAVQDVAFP